MEDASDSGGEHDVLLLPDGSPFNIGEITSRFFPEGDGPARVEITHSAQAFSLISLIGDVLHLELSEYRRLKAEATRLHTYPLEEQILAEIGGCISLNRRGTNVAIGEEEVQ